MFVNGFWEFMFCERAHEPRASNRKNKKISWFLKEKPMVFKDSATQVHDRSSCAQDSLRWPVVRLGQAPRLPKTIFIAALLEVADSMSALRSSPLTITPASFVCKTSCVNRLCFWENSACASLDVCIGSILLIAAELLVLDSFVVFDIESHNHHFC